MSWRDYDSGIKIAVRHCQGRAAPACEKEKPSDRLKGESGARIGKPGKVAMSSIQLNTRTCLAYLMLLSVATACSACEESEIAQDAKAQDEGQAQAGATSNEGGRELAMLSNASSAPGHSSFWAAFAHAEANPEAEPPGVNDWDCKPSKEHPNPVVLVHGTWVNHYDSFAKMAPYLEREGYCIYSLNFGKDGAELPFNARYGTSGLAESVIELRDFSNKVLDATGSAKIDMVGWSQGGVLIRSYLQDHGGADKNDPSKNRVDKVVTLGSPHHGTALSGIAILGNLFGATSAAGGVMGQAAVDQALSSDFLEKLNQDGDTRPGITYTSIYTSYDNITNPVSTSLLKASGGATVKNILVQDGCLVDFSDHLALPFTDRVIALVAQALDPEHEYKIPCKLQMGSL